MKFGTDGIRGRVGEGFFKPENIVNLGVALAKLIDKNNLPKAVYIARDTRESGPMIEMAISSGLSSLGIDIYSLGILPTPAVSHLIQKTKNIAYGIVISASHNPYYDNGIKIFNNKGFKLSKEDKTFIENIYNTLFKHNTTYNNFGQYHDISTTAQESYFNTVKKSFNYKIPFKIVVDTANGAFSYIAESILKSFSADVYVINNTPDGKNINKKCGATNLDTIIKAVKDFGADLGISFDGDGDRVMFSDSNGRIVDGDYTLAIIARHMKENEKLSKNTVVITPMTNLGFIKAMSREGVNTVEVPVGDQNIIEELFNNGYKLGGEQSGHIISTEYTKTGDGLFTALELMQILVENSISLSEARNIMKKYPQILINIPVHKKTPIEENKKLQRLYQEASRELGTNGRINIRYSGTEPLLRIMIEADNNEMLQHLSSKFKIGLKHLSTWEG